MTACARHRFRQGASPLSPSTLKPTGDCCSDAIYVLGGTHNHQTLVHDEPVVERGAERQPSALRSPSSSVLSEPERASNRERRPAGCRPGERLATGERVRSAQVRAQDDRA